MKDYALDLIAILGAMFLLPVAVFVAYIRVRVMQAKRRRSRPAVCDACGSADVRHSWKSGFTDRVLGASGCVPYRCRACRFRFHRFEREQAEERVPE